MTGSSVEDEIVSMKFDNTQFERAVAVSLGTLDKLKKSLVFPNTTTSGLDNIAKNVRGFSLNPMVDAAGQVGKAFSAMSVVAISAIATLASQATTAATGMVKSLSVAPVTSGLKEYETNLNSIQTILANTGLEGQKGLDKVNGSLNKLNIYSDKTIYNFSEMARNIGTFTAAGVDLDTSTSAIKGIANLAAMSGSSAAQAATGMYQLSQAISTGTVRLMDWNSVSNAGFGGKVFQEAIKETARVHGVAVDELIKKNGSFRDSLQEGWFSSEILTETLSKFTGDLTKKQIMAMGYTEKQSKEIMKQAKVAQDAATKVKTMSQLFGTLQEAAGSGWAKTWQMVFGDFNEAKGLFTGINNVLSGAISNSAKARNKVLGHWKELGGRDLLLDALSKAFYALMDVISPIQKAFRDIFPRQTARDLLELTQRFHDFAENLSLGEDTMDNIRRTARGFFAVLDIGWQIIKGVFGVIGDLFGALGDGSGGFLELTGSIGDWLVKLDEAIKKGDGLTNFFHGVSAVLAVPIKLFGMLTGVISDLFSGFDTGKVKGATDALGVVGDRLSPIEKALHAVGEAWDWLIGKLGDAGDLLKPLFDSFANIGNAIADNMAKEGFGGVLDVINTALLGTIVILVTKFFGNLSNVFSGGNIIAQISGTFGELRDTLQSFQTQIQAKTLLLIAGAVALLTASIVALSFIDPVKLTKALAAVSVGMGQLLGAMKLLTLATSEVGFIKMPLMAASMILLAGAILVLSAAVTVLSRLSWEELAKGLTGVTVLMIGLAATANLMAAAEGPMLRAGIAMIPLAIGITILAGAMKLMATMSWEEMAKGMAGIAGGLLIIAGAMTLMPASLPITAAGLVLLSVAMAGLAGTMKIFATMSWEEMGKGLAGIAGGLLLIAGAMDLMPLSLPITAAGLLILAPALAGIAGVAKIFATMSWEDMGKAAAGLAGALLILAGGLYLMSGTLAGSAALLVAAAALAVLTPVLVTLGAMSWESIVKGMTALAATFIILGLAGLVLTPLVLPLMGLGVALALIGGGMALAGAGALAMATAFAIFTAAGTAGIAVVSALIALVPAMATSLAEGIIQFANVIASNGDELTAAWVKLLGSLIDGAIKIIPKVGKLFTVMVLTGLQAIRNLAPALIDTGLYLVIKLLEGITNHMDEITRAGTQMVIEFMRGVGKNMNKIAQAGADLILDFLNAISTAIDNNSAAFGEAGGKIAVSIGKGIVSAIGAYGDEVMGAIRSMVTSAASHVDVKGIVKSMFGKNKGGPIELVGVFADLVGGKEQVKDALADIRTQIKDTLDKSGGDIEKWKKRLEDLQDAKVKNPKAIKKAREQLHEAQKLHNQAEEARKDFKKQMKERGDLLSDLSNQYDAIKAEIATWEEKLKTATDAQKAFKDSVMSTFNVVPDIQAGQSLTSYMRQVEAQKKKVEKFKATLAALRAAGLDDNSYKKLLAEGPDAQRLMDQLLAGGTTAITAFQTANQGLEASAQSLADMASSQLGYDKAVADAQNFLKGLNDGLADKAGLKQIEEAMKTIARKMMKALRDELDIKSPSRKAAAVGYYFVKGLVNQMNSMNREVEQATASIGSTALDTLQATMSKLGNGVTSQISMSPVITPVLDLTQLTKDANGISSLLGSSPISADVSFAAASDISESRRAAEEAGQTSTDATAPVQQFFDQTINSPKAVSAVEIWRNTRNLLSQAKEALDV